MHPVDEILDKRTHSVRGTGSPISQLNNLRHAWNKMEGTIGPFPARVIYATTKWDTVAANEYADYDHAEDEFVRTLSDAVSLGDMPTSVIHFDGSCERARHIVSRLLSMPSHDLYLARRDRVFESLLQQDISQLKLRFTGLTKEAAQYVLDFLSLVGVVFSTIIDSTALTEKRHYFSPPGPKRRQYPDFGSDCTCSESTLGTCKLA